MDKREEKEEERERQSTNLQAAGQSIYSHFQIWVGVI
jgi:hypothetical protein